ncbi:MAG: hypothetical protein AAGG48_18265 [Planctomycetota bacterium]
MTDDADTEIPWNALAPAERREIERQHMLTSAHEMRAEEKTLAEINRLNLLHAELTEEIESDYRVQKALEDLLATGLSIDDLIAFLKQRVAYLKQPEIQKYHRTRDVQQQRRSIGVVKSSRFFLPCSSHATGVSRTAAQRVRWLGDSGQIPNS